MRRTISEVPGARQAGYFPGEPVRGLIVQAGLLLVPWLPTLSVPRADAGA
jgi:hypothetical protein